MKKIIVFAFAICLSISVFSQNLAKITITGSGNVDFISIGLENNTFLYLNKDGSIKKYGFDRYANYGAENYMDTLDEYVGRVDYYSATDDAAFRGKVKYIGRFLLTYYASYDNESLRGKLKSIGSINIDYYASFDNEAFKGNIKSIGQHAFSWYANYENVAYRGKLKAVGSTNISYYGSFDDKVISGKVKTLGGTTFTYYTSLDLQQYRGAIKTGLQTQTLNTIKYYVRNY